MKAERHRFLAERIERAVTHCGDHDWEMKIEAAMLAGTHWANYALHHHGVALEDEDIVHTSMLVVNTLRKYSIVEPDLLRALGDIEELRPLFVRGDVDGGPAAAQRALALLSEISARARESELSTTRRLP
ncbi:hypothetical protein [Rhodococcus jostii]|uniref:HEPN domain-containing protein n=1 Tax=Rhodococcus jostii TaxID=132919 RepID=A0A1H5CZF5_RHOJO|nr:hypothetical protein [Rhodococcus jostii]SED71996.1 hypothetical protein SAMN04490220_5319 [Rhodococcus jostii]